MRGHFELQQLLCNRTTGIRVCDILPRKRCNTDVMQPRYTATQVQENIVSTLVALKRTGTTVHRAVNSIGRSVGGAKRVGVVPVLSPIPGLKPTGTNYPAASRCKVTQSNQWHTSARVLKGNGKPLGRHLARNNQLNQSFITKDSINWLHFELLQYYDQAYKIMLVTFQTLDIHITITYLCICACDMNLYYCLGFYSAIYLMTSVCKY